MSQRYPFGICKIRNIKIESGGINACRGISFYDRIVVLGLLVCCYKEMGRLCSDRCA